MKFNKTNLKNIKNVCKVLLIIFLLFFCAYILYFSSKKIVENLESMNKDCSSCIVKPSSGNCIDIKDISFVLRNDGLINFNTSIDISTTNYKFCQWESQCNNSNIISQGERIKLSNNELFNRSILNTTCCSGIEFYNSNTMSFSEINLDTQSFMDKITTSCSIIKNSENNLINALRDDIIKMDDYNKIRQFQYLCNTYQDISTTKGILFEISNVSTVNILKDPNLTIQEIFDYQNILEMSYNAINEINTLNNQLRELNTTPGVSYNPRKIEIQNQLANYFVSTISDETYKYKLVDSTGTVTTNNDYILNENQFFNCFGNKLSINQGRFTEAQEASFNLTNYFDVASDASYTTMQDNTLRAYPNRQDLEMELKNLEQIPPGGNAPVSVINQYLTAINSFYERQMANMLGPRTHAVNQSLEFDNNTLENKNSTFFTYDTSFNNTYDCMPSITNTLNQDFSYCGPEPYYTDLKF